MYQPAAPLEAEEIMRILLIIFAATCVVFGCSGESRQSEGRAYDVVITGNPDGRFIKAIKGIREVTGLGLADAKALFDDMPSVVKSDLPKDEAEAVAEQLRSASLTVEIREK